MVQDDLMHVPDNAPPAVGSGPLLQEVVLKDTSDIFIRQLDLKNSKCHPEDYDSSLQICHQIELFHRSQITQPDRQNQGP